MKDFCSESYEVGPNGPLIYQINHIYLFRISESKDFYHQRPVVSPPHRNKNVLCFPLNDVARFQC